MGLSARRLPCREDPNWVKPKARLNFASVGPTREFVSRRNRKAALGASFSYSDSARVVVLGCTSIVAATARCCGSGITAFVDEIVPDARTLKRRLYAWGPIEKAEIYLAAAL